MSEGGNCAWEWKLGKQLAIVQQLQWHQGPEVEKSTESDLLNQSPQYTNSCALRGSLVTVKDVSPRYSAIHIPSGAIVQKFKCIDPYLCQRYMPAPGVDVNWWLNAAALMGDGNRNWREMLLFSVYTLYDTFAFLRLSLCGKSYKM